MALRQEAAMRVNACFANRVDRLEIVPLQSIRCNNTISKLLGSPYPCAIRISLYFATVRVKRFGHPANPDSVTPCPSLERWKESPVHSAKFRPRGGHLGPSAVSPELPWTVLAGEARGNICCLTLACHANTLPRAHSLQRYQGRLRPVSHLILPPSACCRKAP